MMDFGVVQFGSDSTAKDEKPDPKKEEKKPQKEIFKGPKGRKNVWWIDEPKYKPPPSDKPSARTNLWWRRDLKKKSYSQDIKHGHHSGKWKTCDICTLDYPCNHMSAHKLAVKLRERYEKFPVNEGKRICEEFWKYKSCKHFEKNGKCQFWHPTEPLINKEIPLPRCDVCTKLIEKKYCYKHRPPFGKELCDGDKKLMKLGGEVPGMFKLGEMIGYNSALERKIIYGFVVFRQEKNRSYQVSVTQNASKLLEVSHGKLYRIHGYVSRGWDKLKRVKKLYDKLKDDKKEKTESTSQNTEVEQEKTINWGRLFNQTYRMSTPNISPDDYEDRPDSGGPILFEME